MCDAASNSMAAVAAPVISTPDIESSELVTAMPVPRGVAASPMTRNPSSAASVHREPDRRVGFRCASRQPDGRTAGNAADDADVALERECFAVFARLDDDRRARGGVLEGSPDRVGWLDHDPSRIRHRCRPIGRGGQWRHRPRSVGRKHDRDGEQREQHPANRLPAPGRVLLRVVGRCRRAIRRHASRRAQPPGDLRRPDAPATDANCSPST